MYTVEFLIIYLKTKQDQYNYIHSLSNYSDSAAIGFVIGGKSRQWVEYTCKSILEPKADMAKIIVECNLPTPTVPQIRIPEESTIQCVKSVTDPKKRLVNIFLHFQGMRQEFGSADVVYPIEESSGP